MKKIWKISLTLTMLGLTMAGLVACGRTVDEIKIGTMPQTTYVKGAELDLSKGTLNIASGDSIETIALDSNGITVSGYNPNELGTQEITVNYKKQTTTFTINVVERMTFLNVKTDYFIGESFAYDMGQVRITSDDGSTSTVNLNDSALTVTGFNSSSAASGQFITVKYGVYTGEYSVNVYKANTVSIVKPSNTNVYSHEELNLAGGYLNVSDGTHKSTIPLTSDAVSVTGYDPAAVKGSDSAVSQTITVGYDGREFTFTVSVAYSDISRFIDLAEELSEIEWNSEATITYAQGIAAFDLIESYTYDFNDSERAMISEEAFSDVLCAATVYGYNAYMNSILDLNVLGIGQYATGVYYVGHSNTKIRESYENTKKDYETLSDGEFFALADSLSVLAQLYGNEELYEGITVFDYLNSKYPVFGRADFAVEYNYIGTLLGIYEISKGIPDNWTVADLKQYAGTIEATIEEVIAGGFPRASYDCVSAWRAQDDLMDILYTYIYYYNQALVMDLSAVYVPECIYQYYFIGVNSSGQPVYSYLYRDVDLADYYYTYAATYDGFMAYISGQISDFETETYKFMYYYRDMIARRDAMLATFNDMEMWLYYNALADGKNTLDIILYDIVLDYYDIAGAMIGNKNFEALWDAYMQLLYDDEDLNNVPKLLEIFVNMSPAEQNGFLVSLHRNFYGTVIPSAFRTDDSEGHLLSATIGGVTYYLDSLFVHFLIRYYAPILGDANAMNAFGSLAVAAEYLAQGKVGTLPGEDFDATTASNFAEWMSVALYYAQQDGVASKIAAQPELASAFAKYQAVLQYIAESDEEDIGEWQATITELTSAISFFRTTFNLVSANKLAYNHLYSAWAKIESLTAKITASTAPQAVRYMYYYDVYLVIPSTTEGGADTTYTLDGYVKLLRDVYVIYSSNRYFLDGAHICVAYDFIINHNFQSFFADYAYEIYFKTLYGEDLDNDTVMNAISALIKLDEDAQSFFFNWDAKYSSSFFLGAMNDYFAGAFNTGAEVISAISKLSKEAQYFLVYYDLQGAGLNIMSTWNEYFAETFESENTVNAAEAFMWVVYQYAYTKLSESASAIGFYLEQYEDFLAAYNALSDDEKAEFEAILGSVKGFYEDAYNAYAADATEEAA